MSESKAEDERIRQKRFRDKKRAEGFVHMQAWIKIQDRNKINDFIESLRP